MNSLVSTIQAIEQRARTVRAFRMAAIYFCVAIIPLLSMFLLERGQVVSVTSVVRWALALLPLVVFAVSFLVTRHLPIDLPRILLRVDLSLASDERLSSIYEVYRRNEAGPYRDLLEERLGAKVLRWKRALPLSYITLLFPAGLAMLATVLVISSVVPVSRAVVTRTTDGTVVSSQSGASYHTGSEDRPDKIETETQESSTPGANTGQPGHDLQDVLGNLWSSPSSPGVISGDQEGLDQLISKQREAAQTLKELISQIEKRLAEGDTGLTPEQRDALSALAQQIGNDSLRQALQGLAEEENPDELQKRLQETRELAESLQEPSGSSLAQAINNEPSQPPQDEQGHDLAYSSPMSGEPNSTRDRDTTGGGTPSASSVTQGTQGDQLQEGDEPFGGQSSGSGSSTPTTASPQFTRREIAGTIGDIGDFQDFVTKGIPVEERASSDGGSRSLSVNYDQLRALLTGRMLPPGAEDVVRKYFDDITQGGE